MSQINDRSDIFAAVDDALQSYPLAPVPAHLHPSIMAQIRATPQVPPFRLAWLDYALSLFAASMTAVIIWLLQTIPAQLSLNLQQDLSLFLPTDITLALLSGLVLFATLLLAGIALYDEQTKFASS